jgi:hypothetical protein
MAASPLVCQIQKLEAKLRTVSGDGLQGELATELATDDIQEALTQNQVEYETQEPDMQLSVKINKLTASLSEDARGNEDARRSREPPIDANNLPACATRSASLADSGWFNTGPAFESGRLAGTGALGGGSTTEWTLKAELVEAVHAAHAARVAAMTAQEEQQRATAELGSRASVATQGVVRLQAEIQVRVRPKPPLVPSTHSSPARP